MVRRLCYNAPHIWLKYPYIMLQRRHYVILAEILGKVIKNDLHHGRINYHGMMRTICTELQSDNSNFDQNRFMQAIDGTRGLY